MLTISSPVSRPSRASQAASAVGASLGPVLLPRIRETQALAASYGEQWWNRSDKPAAEGAN